MDLLDRDGPGWSVGVPHRLRSRLQTTGELLAGRSRGRVQPAAGAGHQGRARELDPYPPQRTLRGHPRSPRLRPGRLSTRASRPRPAVESVTIGWAPPTEEPSPPFEGRICDGASCGSVGPRRHHLGGHLHGGRRGGRGPAVDGSRGVAFRPRDRGPGGAGPLPAATAEPSPQPRHHPGCPARRRILVADLGSHLHRCPDLRLPDQHAGRVRAAGGLAAVRQASEPVDLVRRRPGAHRDPGVEPARSPAGPGRGDHPGVRRPLGTARRAVVPLVVGGPHPPAGRHPDRDRDRDGAARA